MFMQRAYLKIVAVIAAIALLGFSTVGNYGASWDEGTEISIVKYNFEWIVKGREIPKDLKYYGVLFNFTAEVAYQAQQLFQQGLNYNPLQDQTLEEGDRGVAEAIYKRLKVKHSLTFLVSLIAYIAVAGIVGILAGWEFAWIAPPFLVLLPRFWGHSFFNPKDVPFAALFTLGTWLGAYLIDRYIQAKPKYIRLGKNALTNYSILYGILIGLVTGIRVGGFFLLFFLPLTHLIVGISKGKFLHYFLSCWKFYLLIGFAWAATTTLIHPASWSNPVQWFIATLQYLSSHAWPGKNTFAGQSLSATEIPWYYLPQWFHITTPVIFQVTLLLALILLTIKYKKLNTLQQACAILVLLQIFFLPIVAILKQSALYNGIRQFIFVLPGIAALCVIALIWIYQTLQKKGFKLFYIALIIVLLSPIAVDAIAVHPYEYVYFNRLAGGLKNTYGQYDHDYWGLSLREGMEWLNVNAQPNSTISIGGQPYLAQMYADSHFKFLDIEEDLRYGKKGKPDYYLSMHYLNLQGVFSDCPIVHQVKRQGASLATIKKCS
ncbi:hypothetical protein [Lusitaniella coriacea]|uniref:hypothetical protein n=1 Tax=Lusitaniella coriacea TaxID=1983105 RepID=UPI003CF366FD